MRKVALIHDWLTGMRGGEKVLEVLCDLFPTADIFTLLHIKGQVSATIEKHVIRTSPLQHVPGIRRYYRHLLPLMPWAIEQFDFSAYDVLISSSHCVAKAAKSRQGAIHVSYCHTPMRYVWDQYDQYFGVGRASVPVRTAMRLIRPYLQRWDVQTASRVHHFYANSHNVQERIQRIYRRSSEVIYPPVDTDFFSPSDQPTPREDYYLIVSAMAPYKRLDLALEACRRMDRRVVVIGEGQDREMLQRFAGSKAEFLGWTSREVMRDHFRTARALLFPGEEDFGIVPLEAQAMGCPVIAFASGGALETVKEGETGVFFPQQTADSLIQAMQKLENTAWDTKTLQTHARRFSREACRSAFQAGFTKAGILPLNS